MHYFPPGLHIKTRFGAYWHHGITHHGNRVIHFSGLNWEHGKRNASVRWTTPERFSRGGVIEVVEYAPGATDPVDVVLARAESLLNRGAYNALNNNCEHVARWCMTGVWVSGQAETAAAAGLGLGGTATATAAAVSVATAAGASGAGMMQGLASTGAIVGGTASTGIGMMAAAPAAVATVAVRRAYRDDATLPAAERAARAKARAAGTAAAVATPFATLAAISALGVEGLAAPGITSGLAAFGGGSMLGGVVATAIAPLAVAAGAAWIVYKLAKRKV